MGVSAKWSAAVIFYGKNITGFIVESLFSKLKEKKKCKHDYLTCTEVNTLYILFMAITIYSDLSTACITSEANDLKEVLKVSYSQNVDFHSLDQCTDDS